MDKRQLKKLYGDSFEDSESYLDYFLSGVSDEDVVCVERGGTVVSALYAFDGETDFWGGALKTSFISAAATLPAFRGQGILRETLQKTFVRLRERGVAAVMLYPFRHDYYTRFDFSTYCFLEKRFYSCDSRPMTEADCVFAAKVYAQYMSGFHGYPLRDAGDIKKILIGAGLSGDRAEILLYGGQPVGYHIYDAEGGLSEFAAVSEEIFSSSGTPVLLPARQGIPSAMVRAIDAGALLTRCGYAAEDCVVRFDLSDPMIEENNRSFNVRIRGGKGCLCGEKPDRVCRMSVSELALCSFGVPEGEGAELFKSKLNCNFRKF